MENLTKGVDPRTTPPKYGGYGVLKVVSAWDLEIAKGTRYVIRRSLLAFASAEFDHIAIVGDQRDNYLRSQIIHGVRKVSSIMLLYHCH